MFLLLGTVFVTSILGSVHCVGMCGPFAAIACADSDKRKSAIAPALTYSLGRLLTYSTVGLVFGAIGMALTQSVSFFGNVEFATVQRVMTIAAGVMMITVGVIAIARYFGLSFHIPVADGILQRIIQPIYRRVKSMPRLKRSFIIGAASCLLPCGWLYTFAIIAAGTGSPFYGMAVMISFWAGTVPIMTALMFGIRKLGQPILQKAPALTAVLVIVVGICTVVYRGPVVFADENKTKPNSEELVEQVKRVDHSELPCCCQD